MAKLGAELLTNFAGKLNNFLEGIPKKLGSKGNIQRIAQKITEACHEHNCGPNQGWMYLTDILRLQVFASSVDEALDIFRTRILPNGFIFNIVRFKPRFSGHLQDMIINFNFLDFCICELQVKLGDGQLPRAYDDQHFLYEALRTVKARSLGMLDDCIVQKNN